MPMTSPVIREKVPVDPPVQGKPRTSTEAGAESPVRTPTSTATSGSALRPQQEGRSHALRAEFAALETRFAEVGKRISQAVDEIRREIVPNGNVGSDLTSLRADFLGFRSRLAEAAASLSLRTEDIAGADLALEGLRQTLNAVEEAERRQAFLELKARAEGELNRAVALVYRGNPEFAPLEDCKEAARRLHAEITSSEWPRLHPECESLAQGQHAISTLVNLACRGSELSDGDCERAVAAVSAAFGTPLAIAAVRGRLSFEDEAKTTTAAPCPACGAQLDPGARFCGECGEKID